MSLPYLNVPSSAATVSACAGSNPSPCCTVQTLTSYCRCCRPYCFGARATPRATESSGHPFRQTCALRRRDLLRILPVPAHAVVVAALAAAANSATATELPEVVVVVDDDCGSELLLRCCWDDT